METLDLTSVARADLALFLDIDGTLIEHQSHPTGAKPDSELLDLLQGAHRQLGGALALVTGRSIEMVDAMFEPLELPVAGIYGLEHRLRPGEPATYAAEPPDLAAVADALHQEFHTVEGIYFERKGPVLAVHTRAAPAAFASVKQAAEAALSRLSEGYRIVAGNAGLEFVPIDALKSAAIHRFLGIAPFAGRRPVFFGDDISDESGFEFVNAHGGISVRVAPKGTTAASFVVNTVAEVRRLLHAIAYPKSPTSPR
ncbi:trehalose-phosphatase [Arvimicrobium flavum]|uniref:trehalose-phosphatase n=1 Tax=Arvimicrobium flavum TaxID=3393320 RepID=UPI00237B1FB2|nr:trehalose-phosphatase [Mesorhizobium shangrilense]